MRKSRISPLKWYIEHRLEYLQIKQDQLREIALENGTEQIDAFMEYVENKGRIQELEKLREHMINIGEY